MGKPATGPGSWAGSQARIRARRQLAASAGPITSIPPPPSAALTCSHVPAPVAVLREHMRKGSAASGLPGQQSASLVQGRPSMLHDDWILQMEYERPELALVVRTWCWSWRRRALQRLAGIRRVAAARGCAVQQASAGPGGTLC